MLRSISFSRGWSKRRNARPREGVIESGWAAGWLGNLAQAFQPQPLFALLCFLSTKMDDRLETCPGGLKAAGSLFHSGNLRLILFSICRKERKERKRDREKRIESRLGASCPLTFFRPLRSFRLKRDDRLEALSHPSFCYSIRYPSTASRRTARLTADNLRCGWRSSEGLRLAGNTKGFGEAGAWFEWRQSALPAAIKWTRSPRGTVAYPCFDAVTTGDVTARGR